VLARCLEHAEGLVTSPRASTADDEPALWQREPARRAPARVDRGGLALDRAPAPREQARRRAWSIYAYKGATELARQVVEAKVHRASELEIRALDGAFLDRVAATLDRNNKWELSVSGGGLYLTIGGKLHETTCERIFAPEAK
jgi:uncharacterized protein YaeQ